MDIDWEKFTWLDTENNNDLSNEYCVGGSDTSTNIVKSGDTDTNCIDTSAITIS